MEDDPGVMVVAPAAVVLAGVGAMTGCEKMKGFAPIPAVAGFCPRKLGARRVEVAAAPG